MERRVLFAILLSFVVLYGYQALVVKPVPPASGSTPTGAAGEPTSSASTGAEAGIEASNAPPSAEAPSAAASSVLVGETSEHDVVVDTRDVVATFTNRGARLKSWRLKRFLDEGKPLELVPMDLPGAHPLPFSLQVDDTGVTAALNGGLYAVSGAPAGPADASPTDLRFEYSDTAGVRAVKEFHLEPASYVIGVKTTVTVNNSTVTPAMQWGPALGDITHETGRYVTKPRGLVFSGGKVQRFDAAAIAKQAAHDGDFKYVGVDDHYFLTVALFPGASQTSFQHLSIPPPAGSKDAARDLVSYAITPAPEKVFFGPKDFDLLASIDRDLVRAIDYGMFSVIVVPLLRSLKWVNGFIGNWGWSIVILTLIINGIMFPLRHKSVVSMRKMQEIQPEVKAIQDRYSKLKATDPGKQKMNQELMTLYKERGVNPASGCVPLLLTMPVLFAFWSLLSYSIELRGAPFFGWVHDLSVHDPIYVFPLLMGASSFLQARMTPTAPGADPTQQKMMMYMMPGMMTFFFLWAPAGLALYYFVSNVWAIGQQYLTNRLIGPPNVPKIRPPAERQMKRAGSGRTEAAARTES